MRKAIFIFFATVMMVLLWQCANMRAPTGGPKDVYSPKVVESDPPNYTTHFDKKKIELRFDEFVSVSDVVTEVFISPPLQSSPEIRTRGKSVLIMIDEELRDSTTYSIFFGKAIKDITEGNPIENYNYVFSTGAKIDSLSVIGEVIDAYTLQPREDVMVMLYEDNNDSIPFDSMPYFVKPSYLTRTSEQGFFVMNNLRPGQYRLFALSDENLSATYDNAEEEIAFLDSLVSPDYLVKEDADSLSADSLQANLLDIMADSLMANDSITPGDSLLPDIPLENVYSLYMFKETGDSIQRMLEAEKTRQGVLRFIFRYPAKNVKITPLTTVKEDWMLSEWNKSFDTLRYYIMDGLMDTISLKVSIDTIVFDTVSWSLAEAGIPLRGKERDLMESLRFTTSRQSPFPHFKDYTLSSAYPIDSADFSRFLLVEGEDSISANMEIYGDAQRMMRLVHELKEGINYTLFFPDSVVTDVLGRSNDTTRLSFRTDAYEDYGRYTLHIHNQSPYDKLIIQLLDKDEKLLREARIGGEGDILWDYLKPGKYLLKAIGDKNGNGKWDSGNYLANIQPEPVVYHKEILEVREAWSFETDWYIEFK
ncbi:MAG: Ig-like domain-containing domain [Bacteroidales bacterium]|nr:Ig-like domain-containing domain [Bacteroidales bacterium]